MLASLSLASNLLIAYSSILNLKYVMDHYKAHQSKFTMCMDYLMLTFLGIFTTIVPMQLLEIARVALNTVANLATCCWADCNKKAGKDLSHSFDKANQCLTYLTVYQVQCIKFAIGISKLTYENVLWLLL